MREVTLRELNKEFVKELISSRWFWSSFAVYFLGSVIMYSLSALIGGIIMFISALSMLNADWNGRNKVVKRLRWIK